MEAVRARTCDLQYGKSGSLVEAEVQGCFDQLDHTWLGAMLRERIEDRAVLRLSRKGLKAGMLETDGRVVPPETGSPQGGSSSPSWPLGMCTTPGMGGSQRVSRPTGAARPSCAALPMTGSAPFAIETMRNGCIGCGPKGGRNATCRWRQTRPTSCEAVVSTPVGGGASRCWDASGTGGQIVMACRASHAARHARSARPPAGGWRQGANHIGICRGVNAPGGGTPGGGATAPTTVCTATAARGTAVSSGPGAGCSHGAIGAVGSGRAAPGHHVPRALIEDRKPGLASRKSNDGGYSREGNALHRGRAYNRGTGCGKTARPGLHGGCRVTGIPTVEPPKSRAMYHEITCPQVDSAFYP